MSEFAEPLRQRMLEARREYAHAKKNYKDLKKKWRDVLRSRGLAPI